MVRQPWGSMGSRATGVQPPVADEPQNPAAAWRPSEPLGDSPRSAVCASRCYPVRAPPGSAIGPQRPAVPGCYLGPAAWSFLGPLSPALHCSRDSSPPSLEPPVRGVLDSVTRPYPGSAVQGLHDHLDSPQRAHRAGGRPRFDRLGRCFGTPPRHCCRRSPERIAHGLTWQAQGESTHRQAQGHIGQRPPSRGRPQSAVPSEGGAAYVRSCRPPSASLLDQLARASRPWA